ncbi:MAG TPA: hypothetical protein VEH04_17795 [Verrucomicrobiae bacterium]|nr:hypothetical protein [Verrucomicrobiae bacterium]
MKWTHVAIKTVCVVGSFFLCGAHAQVLTNGVLQAGALAVNTTNSYTFAANAGDALLLRAGAPAFRPRLDVYNPGGIRIGAAAGASSSANDALLVLRATNSGIFTVSFSAFYGNASGDYSITLGRVPGDFVVSAGDQGGELTNGFASAAAIALGDLDLWRLDADAGDTIAIRVGAPGFRPYVLLYGPNGVAVAESAGATSSANDAALMVRATNGGTFTAVVQSYYDDGAGGYTINLAKSGGEIMVAAGDESGPLINGATTLGSIELGDIDVWEFTADAGENVSIRAGAPTMRPWLAVIGPNGALQDQGFGAASGANDANVSFVTTNAGTFRVLLQSYYDDNTSDYALTLAKVPGVFVVSPGDEGGELTNGVAALGTNTLGDLDVWSFSAMAGDQLVLRVGAPNLRPWLRLFGPTGKLLGENFGSVSSDHDAYLSVRSTNSGVFTVLVQSVYDDAASPYSLTAVRVPATIFVGGGDEGGSMTNGAQHLATNSLGDLDAWTFLAQAGDTVLLRMGAPQFRPRMDVYGPSGEVSATAFGTLSSDNDAGLSFVATNSGIFTVVAHSYYLDGTGEYRINHARIPAPFVIHGGDEGGLLAGSSQEGTIELGDLDVWRFGACRGQLITLVCNEAPGSSALTPRIRLFGPSGVQVASVSHVTSAVLNYFPTNTGIFTAVIDAAAADQTGSYQLTGNGLTDELSLCVPRVAGSTVTIEGLGGNAHGAYALATTTNLATSGWQRIQTNHFNLLGNFVVTNVLNVAEPQRYFRVLMLAP